MTQWFHRTCLHSHADIGEHGIIEPKRQQMLGINASWWSFSPSATALELGLASHKIVSCDRMEFQYTALGDDEELIIPWAAVSRQFQMGNYLEATKGTRPTLWGISFEPVRVGLVA